jgi:hypothetical protein
MMRDQGLFFCYYCYYSARPAIEAARYPMNPIAPSGNVKPRIVATSLPLSQNFEKARRVKLQAGKLEKSAATFLRREVSHLPSERT